MKEPSVKHLSAQINKFDGADVRKVTYVDKIRRFYSDNEPLGQSPYLVEFIPTPYCNSKCTFCSYWHRNSTNRSAKSELDISIILSTISKFTSSTKGIFVAGGGEPTIYSHIDKLLSASEKCCATGLCSNYRDISRLSDDVLGRLSFHEWSIVAGDRDTYNKVTGSKNNKFMNVENNILRIQNIRNSTKSSQYIIGKVLICRENYHSIMEILRYLDKFALDVIALRLVNNYEGRDVELSEHQLNELNEIAKNNNIDTIVHIITHKKQCLTCHNAQLTKSCYTVTEGHFAIIDCDGEVYLCVPSSCDKRFSIGNVNNTSWEKIWNSPKHKNVVDQLNSAYISGGCQLAACRHYNSNLALEGIREGTIDDIDIQDFERKLGPFI